MKMILMSVLLSAQVERLSASRMQEFVFKIGFMKQQFFFLNILICLFYSTSIYIFHMLSEIDAVHSTTS